jgi:hypothetical protein
MNKTIWVLLLCAGACEKATDQRAPAPASRTMTPNSSVRPGDIPRTRAPFEFDPHAVRVGMTLGELKVSRVDIQPAYSDVPAAGSVAFTGNVELVGSYRPHFDYPEVKEPCFWVDLQSWRKLPRAQGDGREVWFCFENRDEAIRQLGALTKDKESHVTIVVDNYTTHLSQSDAWDTARLVRVVKKEVIE